MSVYRKSNMPTNVVRALTGRIEDVIMGHPLDSAKSALEAVLTLVAAQTPVEPTVVPVPDAVKVALESVEGPNA